MNKKGREDTVHKNDLQKKTKGIFSLNEIDDYDNDMQYPKN